MKTENTLVSVIKVLPRGEGKGGLKVTLKFEKTKTTRFLWFKPRIQKTWRVEEFTNWHDLERNFFFHTCNCPDVPYEQKGHPDSWDYWLQKRTSMRYPFCSVSRNEIRKLVDEWFIVNGHDVHGGWEG